MAEKDKIPKHWQLKKLGEVCKLKNGYAFKSDKYQSNGVPVIRISDINGGTVSSRKAIRVEAKSDYENYLVENNDILVAMSGATTGKFGVYQSTEKAYQNQRVGKFEILNKSVLNNEFLFHQINSLKRQIEKDAYGGAQPNISSTKIEQMQIVVPPLPEQQAIVSKIEALFSELEKGKEQLLESQRKLKVYRQSLLKWAFEGKLTNKNVKEGELPVGWEIARMDDVCAKIQDGSHFSPQVQYDEPGENRFKYITAKNIRNNYMDFRKVVYVDKEYHDSIYPRCNPEYGDVLLTKDGVNTGEVTLNTLHEPFSLLSSVCVFKTKRDKLISAFLKYFIQSPFGNEMIVESMTGTAIKRIVLRKIKEAKIILPPLNEQQLLVSELESKLNVCNKIEETITESLQQSERLRLSILKTAFEGKLVSAIELNGVKAVSL